MQNLQIELIRDSYYPQMDELDKVYRRLTLGELLLNNRVAKKNGKNRN